MSIGYIEERCSCSAKFKVPAMMAGSENLWENATVLLKEWRETHVHEFEPAPEDAPTVIESGSSHERLGDEFGASDRVPAGFAAA